MNKDDIDWLKSSALDKVYFYIYETEIQTPSSFFKVKDLENMYIDILQCHNIIISPHVSHFSEDLITRYEALEKRKVKKQVIIYFKIAAENLFNDALSAPFSFFRSMYRVIIPLRKMLSSKINNFDGSFDEGCQTMSVPEELLTLISILIDGPSVHNTYYSQPALTVSQLILSNFKQKSQSNLHHSYRQQEFYLFWNQRLVKASVSLDDPIKKELISYIRKI